MQTPLRLVAVAIFATLVLSGAGPVSVAPSSALFAQFDLPEEWKTQFWAEPEVKALLALESKAIAKLVPTQAGLRYCRCPNCDATEQEDPLRWNLATPDVLTCRRCKVVVPNDKFPAKDEKEKKVPEETIEVLPQVIHHYPYHVVDPEKQRYPDEHIFLAAKRDYEAREFLAKAALYAAVRAHERPPGVRDPVLTRLACVVILRFAQVYPAYATHYDQPNQPKFFQPAHVPPPYRRGFKTGKWDWTASLDVPLNLVIAYALLRDDPAIADAGRLLGDPDPVHTIEHDFFRASADFVRAQPDDYSERSLQAYRGLLAAGQVLNDPELIKEAHARLTTFAERGFYHDGYWRQGDPQAHRRVLGMIDGWINRLLLPASATPEANGPIERAEAPMLALARSAGAAVLMDPPISEIQPASWPALAFQPPPRHPILLGGAGVARLTVGQGPDSLDLELRGPDSFGSPHFQRLAVRLAIGGHTVLGDLDDLPPRPNGWDRATACHNTVVVDGLNQRESAVRAEEPAAGADVLFFAADPDFQVATLSDAHAYPRSTTRYRHTIVLAGGPRARYAASIFEVSGGVQHDQIYHAAPGLKARWQVSVPTTPPPATLLPPSIVHVPTARAEDGRWFVQAYGEFTPLSQAQITRPIQAWLTPSSGGTGVRLHMLSEGPATLFTAVSPDPKAPVIKGGELQRAGLILRKRLDDGTGLKSVFVTVFEPNGKSPALHRVGRVRSPEGTVVIYLETADGPEHLVINLNPGQSQTAPLADGRQVATDGPAVRVVGESLILAGGTFAESAGVRVTHPLTSGTLIRVVREPSENSRGWFQTATPIGDAADLSGRVLLIQHGDGSTRGWTIQRAETSPEGTRFHVVEEPGFQIDERTRDAQYYQFPRIRVPGPHQFWVLRIAR